MCNENKDTARKEESMQKLQTVNAETLLYEPLEKPSLWWTALSRQAYRCSAAQKIGKSWLMLAMLMRVAGIPLWDMADNGGRCALPLP